MGGAGRRRKGRRERQRHREGWGRETGTRLEKEVGEGRGIGEQGEGRGWEGKELTLAVPEPFTASCWRQESPSEVLACSASKDPGSLSP